MMRISRVLVIVFSAVVVGAVSGCSSMFVKGPPAGYQNMESFQCTEGKGWVYWDTVQTVGNAAFAVQSAAQSTDEQGNEIPASARLLGVGLGVAFAAIHAASARSGSKRVDHCRKAKAEAFYNSQMRAMNRRSPPTPLRDRIDRDDVLRQVRPVHGKVVACARQHQLQGLLRVRLTIRSDGRIASTQPDRGGNALTLCVQGAFHGVRFPAARRGRTVLYPFQLSRPTKAARVSPTSPSASASAAPSTRR